MSQSVVYRFGEYSLDPAMRELSQAGLEVSLPPKSFDCLVYLVEHRDRAVGRDELISAVWGRIDVSDAVLAQTLLRARRSVGDTGAGQTTIRTIPRFGYRWVAPLVAEYRDAIAADDAGALHPQVAESAAAIGAGEAAIAPAAATEAPPPRARMRWAPAVVLVILAGAGLAAYQWWGARDAGTGPAQESTQPDLAMVLPVAMPSSGNPEQAWVRLGAMDYISSRLRGNGGLNVLPSDQVLQLVGDASGDDAEGLAKRLQATTGARWVVRPSVTRGGKDWTVRLLVAAVAGNGRIEVEARGDTALAAAAAATDSLLRRLGRMQVEAAQAPTALSERLQQIDAELLAGQLANARALVQGAAPVLRDEPELRLREGQVEFRAGRIDEAVALFEGLLARDGTLPQGVRAQASMGLGAASIRKGDFRAAEKRYGDAVEALSGSDGIDQTWLGNAYNGRGIARLELGREDEAIADIGRARLAMQRARNDLEVATVDTNLGMLESRRGNDVRAVQQFDRALATFERFGVTDNLVAVLQAKATSQLRMAQPAAAMATIERAVGRIDRIENPLLRQRVALVRARAYIANGRLREAGSVLSGLDGDAQASAAVAAIRLRLLLNRGADREAAALAGELAARDDNGDEAILLGVQAALRNRDPAAARAWLDGADARTRDSANWTLARALLAVHLRSGAEAALAAAEAAAASEGNADARIGAGCAHAVFLLANGDTDRASAILGELGTLADNDYRIAHTTWRLYRAMGEPDAAQASEAAVRRLAGQRVPEQPLVY